MASLECASYRTPPSSSRGSQRAEGTQQGSPSTLPKLNFSDSPLRLGKTGSRYDGAGGGLVDGGTSDGWAVRFGDFDTPPDSPKRGGAAAEEGDQEGWTRYTGARTIGRGMLSVDSRVRSAESLASPNAVVAVNVFSPRGKKSMVHTQLLKTGIFVTHGAGDKLLPISDLMTGDVGHLLAHARINPNTHIIVIKAVPEEGSKEASRVYDELAAYLPSERLSLKRIGGEPREVHRLYSELGRKDNFYNAGYSTTKISEYRGDRGVLCEALAHDMRAHGAAIKTYLDAIPGEPFGDKAKPKVFLWSRKAIGIHLESNSSGDLIRTMLRSVKKSDQTWGIYSYTYGG